MAATLAFFLTAISTYNNPYGYTSRRHDDETGLMYFRARMFDTRTGEFLSQDPLEYVDGMSLYRAYFVPGGMDPSGNRVDSAPSSPGTNDNSNDASDFCPPGWEFVSGPDKDPIHGKVLPTSSVLPGRYYRFNTYEINFIALGPTIQTNECGESQSGSFTLTWTHQKSVDAGVSVGYFGFGLGYAFGYGIEVSIDVNLPGEDCTNFLAVAVGQRLSVRHEAWDFRDTTQPDPKLDNVAHSYMGMLQRINYVVCKSDCEPPK